MKSLMSYGINEDIAIVISKKIKKYHNQYSVFFKIYSRDDSHISLSITQLDSCCKKLFNAQELEQIAHEVFDPHLGDGRVLNIKAEPITPSPIMVLDVDWIKRKMYQSQTKSKMMAKDLGLQKNALDEYLNGNKELGRMEKSMFYYYLEYRQFVKNTTSQKVTPTGLDVELGEWK